MSSASTLTGSIPMAQDKRIRGLDSLRFFAAFWVAMGHGATFPFHYFIDKLAPNTSLPNSLDGLIFNGSAAVMFFFLISGFCIHHPNIGTERFAPLPFLVRRYVRIGIPLLLVIAIIYAVGGKIADAGNNVLWTIYCELIYYALYPLLRMGMKRIGTLKLTIAAFVVVFSCALLNLEKMYFWEFGWNAWLIGLPAWLLGCLLAERISGQALVAKKNGVLFWRIGGIALGAGAMFLVFHGPVRVGYPVTLNIFAIYAFFWIKAELIRYITKPPLAVLEWAGLWSYSLYLIHNMAIATLDEQHLTINPIVFWACQITAISICSYMFYAMVEKPSHLLARYLSNRLRYERSQPVSS